MRSKILLDFLALRDFLSLATYLSTLSKLRFPKSDLFPETQVKRIYSSMIMSSSRLANHYKKITALRNFPNKSFYYFILNPDHFRILSRNFILRNLR